MPVPESIIVSVALLVLHALAPLAGMSSIV